MPTQNKIPESITQTDLEAALRVLGIDAPGTNLISLRFDLVGPLPFLTVTRNVKSADGRIVGVRVAVEVPIERGA